MSTKVLLLSSVRWPSVARLAAGFAQAGCVVDALAPWGAAITASRYLAQWYRYTPLVPHTAMCSAISRAQPDLLVCCDERAVAQLLTVYERADDNSQIAQLIRRSVGDPVNLPRLISRSGFIAEARDEGIRVPETLAISGDEELREAVAILGFPLVMKADGSWGGEGVIVARNIGEARAGFKRLSHVPSLLRGAARALKRRDMHFAREALTREAPRVSAQKFVAGMPAASAFAAWRGEVVGAIHYDVLIADGAIGPPNVIRRVDCPQLKAASEKIARRFQLSGLHGLDFVRDATGAAHLIEINPRATQGSTLAFGPGRDLPAALAGCVFSRAGIRPAMPNDVVAIFPREWRRDPSSPYLACAHHDVPWDDPGVLFASLGIKAPKRPRTARPRKEKSLTNNDQSLVREEAHPSGSQSP